MDRLNATYAPLVVVGSGRAAINVLSRLPSRVLAQTTVIDPSGTWLHAFARFALRLGATHLRSTVHQHPFASACGLERFVEENERQSEVVHASEAYAGTPSVRVFAEYCARMISEQLSDVRVIKGSVVDAYMVDESAICELGLNDPMLRYGGMMLTLESGEKFLAAQCVWTPKRAQALAPSWVIEAKSSYGAANPTYDGQGSTCGIMTARDVDLGFEGRVKNRTILVVGGGMSAATLALEASRKGARSVTLLPRRRLDVSEFECDVKYFGCKGLREFHGCSEMSRRAELLDSYKSKASVNEHMHRQLIEESSSERSVLSIIEQHVVRRAEWHESKRRWSVTTAPTEEAKLEFETKMYERLRDEGIQPNSMDTFDQEKTGVYDEIWIACGEVVDITRDQALRSLIATSSVEIARGLPALVEETFDYEHGPGGVAPAGGKGGCRWPNTSMYVIGAYSALTIGPGADYPVGHRIAAKQIVDALKKHQTMVLMRKINPYRESALANICGSSIAGPCTPELSSEKQVKRLPVEKARHGLIDASSVVPKDFERVELDRFDTCEEDMTLDIRIQLPEPVNANNVHVVFDTQAFEMWAVGTGKRAFRFFVAKLYKDVIVERCSYQVFPSKNRVKITLHKRNNLYWRFLRG